MSGNALTNADSEPGVFARVVSGRRSKWAVFAAWLVVIIALGSFATKLNGAQKNDTTSWLPKSAESTKELKIEGDFHPNWYPAILLYARSTGLTDADKAQAQHAAAVMEQDPPAKNLDLVVHSAVQVIALTTGPNAGKAIQIIVPVNPGSDGWNKFPDTVAAMKAALGPPTAGLQTYVTGPMGEAGDEADAFKKINGSLTYFTGFAVIIILLIAYRSPILWLLPLITVGGAALTVAESVIYLLAKHAGLTVNGQAAFILIVLVFGAGTDYALLLIARYREELRRYEDRHEAMAHAVHRAGPALVASSATVAVSMLILLVAEMNSTKGMGPVLAIGVIIALCAMLTLMPALLVIVGRWVFWPVRPTFGSDEPTQHGVWARMGKRIAVRPRAVWVGTAVVLVALAGGIAELNAHQQTVAEQFVTKPASVTGAEVQAQYFPDNSGQPLAVIGDAAQADTVVAKLKTVPGVDPNGVEVPKTLKNPVVNGHFYVEAALTDAPDSKAAQNTVDRVRAAVHSIPGANAVVGGGPAVTLDIARASSHDSKLIIPLILLAVFIILGLLLRAFLAPLLLILTVILSFGASLGISALVFKGLGWHGVDIGMPLFGFVFLVALGIDYNIFLMTRIREESVRRGTRRGALVGLSATGGVITWAGLVLAATFGVLATLPIVPFAEIGFAVALGVLLDTMIVRSVLVTALTLDIGKVMWWPSRLSRSDEPDGGTLAAARSSDDSVLV
ncbi:MMPL family transporter [Catenulispora pinisilvae]|uniref:MMPL family transporter n=1 Tax=Catenulispora pinisilvae TaxID=2705253 RepID=UPI0018913E12|nr:MMPL family transporter [Catenulispora pinisilvae]